MARRSTISGLLNAARQALQAGHRQEARKAIDEVLSRDPRNADAHEIMGLILLTEGGSPEAVEKLRRAVDLADSAQRRMSLALALRATGADAEARTELEAALQQDRDFIPAHMLLGHLLHGAGEADAAAASFAAALTLSPMLPEAQLGLARVRRAAGDPDGAVRHLTDAACGAPADAAPWRELASIAFERDAMDQAIDALNGALSRDPADTSLFARLCEAYARRDAAGHASGTETEALSAQALDALYDVISTVLRAGFWEAAAAGYAEIARRNPNELRAQSQLVFFSNYTEADDPMRTVVRATAMGRQIPREGAPQRWWPATDDPERRLRVGLVSDDFRDHVVRFFLLSFLQFVDRSQIEFFAYSSTQIEDDVTARYRQVIRNWFDAETTSDVDLADRVAADRIDILIDLGGHTQRPRLGVFARRPAPVQASWLGYSGTTGVAEIDYIMGDRFVTPDGAGDQFVETPWRLPDSYLCYQPRRLDLAVGPLPALATRRVTFGSLNLLAKISDATVALWSDVLTAVPRSRLVIKSNALADARHAARQVERFARHGIDADRLNLVSHVASNREHLATYQRIDIALDPFPYNGTTTTAEALWMGVPVLTLRGDRFIARVGESMVSTVGHPEWVGHDRADFIGKAAALASDGKRLAALRGELRAELLGSPLCDGQRFASHFEAALRGMWRVHCGTLSGPPV